MKTLKNRKPKVNYEYSQEEFIGFIECGLGEGTRLHLTNCSEVLKDSALKFLLTHSAKDFEDFVSLYTELVKHAFDRGVMFNSRISKNIPWLTTDSLEIKPVTLVKYKKFIKILDSYQWEYAGQKPFVTWEGSVFDGAVWGWPSDRAFEAILNGELEDEY